MKKVETLPLVPLRDIVVFPQMIIPLFVARAKSIKAIDQAMTDNKNIVLATQKMAKIQEPASKDIYDIGIVGDILQTLKMAEGAVKVLVEGVCRAKILSFTPKEEFFEVNIRRLTPSEEITRGIEALYRHSSSLFEQYARLGQKLPQELVASLIKINDPGHFSDMVIAHLPLKITDKQDILATLDLTQRLEKISQILESEIEILKIERRVRGRIKKQMEKSQKEYYLQEQMKAIQKELGKHDDFKSEIEELKDKIKKAKMPKDVNDKALSELKRLEMMPPMAAEATVVRNYIDWLAELPWQKKTQDKLDIKEAEKILNEDHYGLSQVKERIVEYLAVRKLVEKMKGPILCFVGPPGVGKTSLGRSIARAMGRSFVRLSLGGVRDEAEIRGHRRTYIGALPGRIIQSMKKAGSKNPVFLLDEVDKMSTDFRGDPSSALLEVLDPEQNHSFSDHYLEVDFDLSEVLFITTANVLYSIPQPLQDRMEVLRLPGYTDYEKIKIAEDFLIPKKLAEHGLTEKNMIISRNAIRRIIQEYTREAGVRNLDREIAAICRKVAKDVAKKGKKTRIKIGAQGVTKYLGVPKYRPEKTEEMSRIGLATGLAWTEFGGELLLTEVIIMDGKGKLILTGKLGEVMQESAQAALSYVRSRSRQLGLEKYFYQKKDIHIHVPEGAIPKDGPSAGITMATALVSALTKRPVRNDVAMTGEITLRGRVLPIGGVKEKILAAHRYGISYVILPRDNEKDLKEIPVKIRKVVKIILVENMDEVLANALQDFELEEKEELREERIAFPEAFQEISPAH
ncbi:MAG: endopeptidase La [Nitrospinae bacterium RIFCSPLOWO2_12_FULL_45_22]|nr:MAG: endopeptidase La [Nitrospinae bacterium RIFCSPLOWO2_12_FULL_45_22]